MICNARRCIKKREAGTDASEIIDVFLILSFFIIFIKELMLRGRARRL